MRVRAGLRVAARLAAATLGSYTVTAGAAALMAAALVAAARLSRSDALIASSMASYLLFACLMLWCFAERRLDRVWLILLAMALTTHGAALLIEQQLPVSGEAA